MDKQFIEERQKIAREMFIHELKMNKRGKFYGENPDGTIFIRVGATEFIDPLIKDTILATEGEMVKKLKTMYRYERSMSASMYDQALDDIISTLTPE